MPELVAHPDLSALLRRARTVAVLGASSNPRRAGHYVPAYLLGQGYRVLPVNPAGVGQTWFGQPVVATLAELDEPIDLIDVFRSPDQLMGHLPEILALDPAPGAVWLQLGIRHEAFVAAMAQAGIDVVQDRCTLADHRAWGLGAPAPR
jgi:hypothetical protein